MECKVHQGIAAGVFSDPQRWKHLHEGKHTGNAESHAETIEEDRILAVIEIVLRIGIECSGQPPGRSKADEHGDKECFAGEDGLKCILVFSVSCTDRHIEACGAPDLDVPRQHDPGKADESKAPAKKQGVDHIEKPPVRNDAVKQVIENDGHKHAGDEPQTVSIASDLYEEVYELICKRPLF